MSHWMEMSRWPCAILMFASIIQDALCLTEYKTCADVATSLGSNATDGEYVLYLNRNVGVSIYCTGFKDGSPQEYLTLKAGRMNNFASVYTKVGATNLSSCHDSTNPVQMYDKAGRSEFDKIRLDMLTLHIQMADFSFTQSSGSNNISYGNAGDKFAAGSDCSPRGTFKIDLAGTPFVVASNIQWSWQGSFVRGNASSGMAHTTHHGYIGCFTDTGDRLLSGHMEDNPQLTTEICIQLCKSRGFWFAGTQYRTQCFCGDNHDRHSLAKESACDTSCAGNPKEICGGTWKVSVYGTGIPQIIEGRCGGYPGNCFPATTSSPSSPLLVLQVAPTHPCLQPLSPCRNEGKCIASTVSAFRCLCYPGFSGPLCDLPDQVIVTSRTCPDGTVAEKCTCDRKCPGAMFNGDRCKVYGLAVPQLTCRTGDGDHIVMFNVEGSGLVKCPPGSNLTSCTFRDRGYYRPPNSKFMTDTGEATQIRYNTGTCSLLHSCQTCTLQARCKKYECGCQNGGHCHMVTGECICTNGYYGEKCENFDYCGFYEKHNDVSACGEGGICSAVPQNEIKAYGGDSAGDTCLFPFKYAGNSFGSCVQKNNVGPPFACGTMFDGQRDGYIDLGLWSPGYQYTIAAWVRPDLADRTRRTIVGGVGYCKDFGLYHFENFWAYYRGVGSDNLCTRGLGSDDTIQTGQWYLVASIKNSTHVTLYVNGKLKSIQASPKALATTGGLWIGGEECCQQGRFKGMIKTVKIWKRALSLSDLIQSMETRGNANSTLEALNGGLVGHWELGEVIPPPCVGEDHGGEDWIFDSTDTMIISGVHCNISQFSIAEHNEVFVKPWDGHTGGSLTIEAKNILIAGSLNAHGAGYRGGNSPSAGATGQQGESYPGLGHTSTQDNRGGGGGGEGAATRPDGIGRTGGGGGYGVVGIRTSASSSNRHLYGSAGRSYGNAALSTVFLGSGGGSGGSAKNLSINPPGGKGGNGGGAISLKAEFTVILTGKIVASGEDGQGDVPYKISPPNPQRPRYRYQRLCPEPCTGSNSNCTSTDTTGCWDQSGTGGGGSGGSILIRAKTIHINVYGRYKLDVSGGSGGRAALREIGGRGGTGRVHLEYIIYRGSEQYHSSRSQIYSSSTLKNEYMDHSQAGQRAINLTTTRYGNEVLRGCFVDNSTYRILSVRYVPGPMEKPQPMTQKFCTAECRQRGYKYSGTENHGECYCDNHLKMELKRPDGECNAPCQGDATEMCGGTNRILVVGPPPSSPAIGHSGAVSKCQSWCVTADLYTDRPKWGQCSMSTEFISSWQIHCECPAGVTGIGCTQACPEGVWGESCRRNCSCNHNNTLTCLAETGRCQCKPGYYKEQCNASCPTGRYGANCLGRCNCTGITECNKATGHCMCQAGWYGHSCKFPCPDGHWGRNCSNECQCSSGHGSCNPVDGTCECFPGYELPFCADHCEPGRHGRDCSLTCNCNSQNCNPVSGVCDCDSGFTGHSCDQPCPFNKYGKHCSLSCECFADMDCDHKTGACTCAPGFLGPHCEQSCPEGTYGLNCQDRCLCQMNQTNTCESSTGLCFCKEGFMGDDCKLSCPIGLFGPNCGQKCFCHNEAKCDRVTGTCTCPPGWTGASCENVCPDPYYGNCSTICSTCLNGFCDRATGQCRDCSTSMCKCSEGFYGQQCDLRCNCIHGHCSSTGKCACSPGWQGELCDTPCPPDHYGVGCNQTCHCVHGKCHQETGLCVCDPGYQGDVCDQPCSNTTYGSNCRRSCQYCGQHTNKSCDSKTGHCLCMLGYSGIQCNQPCPANTFGANCSQTCRCTNGGTCRPADGFCYCPDGWTGDTCSTKCPSANWGYGCANKCNCGPHSTQCDAVTGKCTCQPGFIGALCRDSCPDGRFGQNCNQSCPCNPTGFSVCSPIDGSCQCRNGYTGKSCERVCDPGRWGLRCMESCECSNRGNCNPFNGQCDCDPGYNGTNCQLSCPPDEAYGKRCSQLCDCNGGHCDPRYGTCSCPPGKKGHHCKLVCESTHFGFECAQPCVCENEGICNAVNGVCRCQPGWSGVRCDHKCPEGQFGVDCGQACPPCENDGSCDSRSGECVCASGFMGPSCNSTCVMGSWGSACMAKCPVSCPLTCFTTTGMCTCLYGTCLNGGTCDIHKGTCMCIPGFHGSDCSQVKGAPGTVSAHTSTSTRTSDSGGLSISKGSMAGLMLGLIILALIAVTAVFLLMRKKYTGQFINGGIGGLMGKMSFSPEVKSDSDDGAVGFSNPLHFSDFTTPRDDPDQMHKDSAA